MKYRLAESTLRKYDAQQLANHFERIQFKFDLQVYRIDRAYNSLYELGDDGYRYIGTLSKHNLEEELYSLYFAVEESISKACN